METYIMFFSEIGKDDLPAVGGKGANLGEMSKGGLPVPPGFCITTSAYREFGDTSPEMAGFFRELDTVSPDRLDEVRRLGQRIREHLESIAMPEHIEDAILKAWRHNGEDKAYAVRSSATAEDLPTASFAGQQETYLNVRGEEQLLLAVQRCWASLFTERAIVYRAKNGFDHRSVFLSVVVQEMVFPEVSGIMFTADPITGRRQTVSIDASFGLGEALVSGLVSADLYQVRANTIIQKKVAVKKLAIYSLPEGGTVTRELSAEQQLAQALSDEEIVRLAALGRDIEHYYGSEQDIEWCLSGGNFYIVQSRPITSLYPVPQAADDQLHVFISLGHQQMMTDAMTPLAISLWRTMFPFGKQTGAVTESAALVGAGGRMFADPTQLLLMGPGRRILPSVIGGIDERMSSGLKQLLERSEFNRRPLPGVRSKTAQIVIPLLGKVAGNVLYRDVAGVAEQMGRVADNLIDRAKEEVERASGAEKVSAVQRNVSAVIPELFKHMLPIPLSGIVSLKLLERLTRRWLGETSWIAQLNKSLPHNATSEMGLMIGDLADEARKQPAVVHYLQTADDEHFLDGLANIRGGDRFYREIQRFLELYGMRCPGEIDIGNKRWREAPTLLVPSLISHIRSVSPGEHREKFAQGKREAEQAAEELLAKVERTPGGYVKKRILARLITVFRSVMGIREYPKYTFIRLFDIYKQAIMAEGAALQRANVIDDPQDVLFLKLDELAALLDHRFPGDVRELIAARRKTFELDKKRNPPRLVTSEGENVTGQHRNVQAPEGALTGTPVSAGSIEGIARVVLRPEEAQLSSDEIMIAPFTDPGWTPLFYAAKGLVMEVGGMMTHGAVVAREYGIPAVVGIDRATEIIKTGDRIRVDGTQGYVLILSRG
ncbi:phosphoenolpyruvate synthase [Paenibacillus thalictri]|uniref:Phosphoenolpyruvate synthase n=1 Tax=Paenibacillus thalictri TaxID=2527873 RepID=A0A4Q9DPR3_9BACL|nr:phosphoenolpyruvate synthase [Paenibacillus thalictri]TBL76638.1 phosphoenolpyruvate synthase [Paenibacillus thalictri]